MRRINYIYIVLLILLLDLIIIACHFYLSEHRYLGSLFDLDQEANLPTWFTSFKLTIAGVFAVLIFQQEKAINKLSNSNQLIWMWLLIALLMFFMSADETAQLHETITRWFIQTPAGVKLLLNLDIGTSGGTLIWGVLFSPLLILIAVVLLNFYLQRFKHNRVLIILTLMMLSLFVGSFLLEQQEAHLAGQLNNITMEQLKRYQLMTLIEESCELFATSFLLIIHYYYHKQLDKKNGASQ